MITRTVPDEWATDNGCDFAPQSPPLGAPDDYPLDRARYMLDRHRGHDCPAFWVALRCACGSST